jgi:hypothetical protein
MREDIGLLSLNILSTSPVSQRMRKHPEDPEWRRVLAFAQRPELIAFRGVLSGLAQDTFKTGIYTITENLLQEAGVGPKYATCLAAAELAEASAEETPGAALILAVIALFVWSRSWGPDLHGDFTKTLHEGWYFLPHACAIAGFKAEAYSATLAFIDDVYDAMYSIIGLRQYSHPALKRLRRVARVAAEAYDGCIKNLADDMRDACLGDSMTNFRPEVCSLLWSLGYVPHSYAYACNTGLPSRQLCQQVIRKSIQSLAVDRLTQFIWLAMRDRGPFDLRQHASLFANINTVYNPNQSDVMIAPLLLCNDPNELFVDVLIRWFAGTLEQKEVDGLQYTVLLYRSFEQPLDGRIEHLFYLLHVAKVFTPTHIDKPDHQAIRGMIAEFYTIVGQSRRERLFLPHIDPSVPGQRLGSHYIIEAILSRAINQNDPGAVEEAFDIVEKFRQADNAYWNLVQPILPVESEAEAMGSLLSREKELIGEARGAYFMLLSPRLPHHYRRFDLDAENYRHWTKFTYEHGHEEMTRILTELEKLYQRMEENGTSYVRARIGKLFWDQVLNYLRSP